MKKWCVNNASGKSKTQFSTNDDNTHKAVMVALYNEYKEKLNAFEKDGWSLEYATKIKPSDILNKLGKVAPSYMVEAMADNKKLNGSENSITPDGGVIWMVKRNSFGAIEDYKILLITEAKSQDSAGETLGGNAIERMHKNIDWVKNYVQYGESWMPYIITCHGNDFNPNRKSGRYQYGKMIANCPKLNAYWFGSNLGEPKWATVFIPDYEKSAFFTEEDYLTIFRQGIELSIEHHGYKNINS